MHSINNVDEGMTHAQPLIPDVPSHPCPTYRPPPKPIRSNMPTSQESLQSSDSSGSTNINTDITLDFEENSPISRRCYFRSLSQARQVILSGTMRIKLTDKYC